jgi:hypothetical protein
VTLSIKRYPEAMFRCALRLGLQTLLALLCFAGIAGAQSTIHICGADLTVGMAKDRVLETTSVGCELKRFPGDQLDLWCARPIGKNSGLTDYEGCDMFQFDQGFLAMADRTISETSGEKVADMMNQVYEFIRDGEASGKSVVSWTTQAEVDKYRYRRINFRVDDRSLVLNIIQPIGTAGSTSKVSLMERLARPPKAQ